MRATDSLMFITTRPDVTFVRGEGSWLFDSEGSKYLDFIQGWAVNSLGHSPKIMCDALAAQAAKVINVSPAYYNEPMRKLAMRIADLSGMGKVFFTNSGAEANEGAIKLARKWGSLHKAGAYEILTFHHAFHGRTLATMAASGKPQWEHLYEPKIPGFRKLPMNDIEAVRAAVGPKTVAVMLEPIQGESGVVSFTDEFLRAVRKLCTDAGLLLILDEIQTGIGRTGKMFCWQHTGAMPDIMTLAKGIGGGVPLGALVAKESVACFEPGDQGGTYNGNPLMTAVGLAVVDEVSRPAFLTQVQENGDYLTAQMRALSNDLGLGEVRGRGLLVALELGRDIGSKVVDEALRQKLLINSPRPASLRFMPALNVTRAEIDAMFAILSEILAAMVNGSNLSGEPV